MTARSQGREAYDTVAEELSGGNVLDVLDTETVQLAREYAKKTHAKWPPLAQVTGYLIRIKSLGR